MFADLRPARSGAVAALVIGSALTVTGVLLWILADVVVHGLAAISWSFLTEPAIDAGRGGGIPAVLVSTTWILAIAITIALPLGIGTALYLAEIGRGRFAQLVGHSLDVLASVPSIVFGLFGSAFFCNLLGLGFSILSGGLTLACMVLPTMIRTAESALRAVPQSLRQGAAALALSRTTTWLRLIVPGAAPGIAAGTVLAIGRALAETAALVFTSGYVLRMPDSVLDSGRALSVHIYDLAMNVPGGTRNAHGAALVLVLALLLINAASQSLMRRLAARGAPR